MRKSSSRCLVDEFFSTHVPPRNRLRSIVVVIFVRLLQGSTDWLVLTCGFLGGFSFGALNQFNREVVCSSHSCGAQSETMDSRLHRIFAGGGAGGGPHPDSPLVDSSEQVYISSLALLKMLKHGMSNAWHLSGIAPIVSLDCFEMIRVLIGQLGR